MTFPPGIRGPFSPSADRLAFEATPQEKPKLSRAPGVVIGALVSGLVVATYALLKRNPEPSEKEVREALSGNICRCTGYGKILEADERASAAMYRR